MNRKIVLLVVVAAFLTSLLSASPASAEFEAPQRSAWGLAGPETTSNAIRNFSALGWTVEESNGYMYVGGKFQNVTNGNQTASQPNLARFSLSGVWDPTFTPTVARPILSITNTPDGNLLVGGEQNIFNGQDVGSLTKIDPATGAVVPGWGLKLTGSTNVVREVTIEADGWGYAVGSFTFARYGGVATPVTNIVRFNPTTGQPDTSWTPSLNGGGWDVSVSRVNNSVYIAGWFTQAAGASVLGAVGISTSNDTTVTWDDFPGNHPNNAGTWYRQYGIEATEQGHVWVAGEQHAVWVLDEQNNYALIKNHITNCHLTLQNGDCTRRGGEFQEIERIGDRIYVTCHCWGHHATGDGPDPIGYARLDLLAPGEAVITGSVSGIVAYNVATGDRDQGFNPYMAGDIGGFGVAQASDGCLWTTGGFNAVGNPAAGPQTPGRDLVRLCDGGGQVQLEAPASCSWVLDGATIDVSWPAANGATDYVIRRSVNGGTQHWRGKVSGLSFRDTNTSGNIVYYVESKSRNTSSSRTQCSFGGNNNPLEAPQSCSAVEANGSIDVTWPAANGATDYIVRRSVNGGTQHWRGKVSGLSFKDTSRSGTLAYYVESKSISGESSTRTQCSFDANPITPQPVASCTATVGANPNTVAISWPSVAEASRYVIYREVNAGNRFWRGAVDAPAISFNDTLRDGNIEYFVAAKFGNTFTPAVACSPVV